MADRLTSTFDSKAVVDNNPGALSILPIVEASRRRRTCEVCQLEFSSGNQLEKHFKVSSTCRRDLQIIAAPLIHGDDTETNAKLKKVPTTITEEISKLEKYVSDGVVDLALLGSILNSIGDLILPPDLQHKKLESGQFKKHKRGIYMFDVEHVHTANQMGLDTLLRRVGSGVTNCNTLARIHKLARLFGSAIIKHLYPTVAPTKGISSEHTSKQKKDLDSFLNSSALVHTDCIKNELQAVGPGGFWAADFAIHRKSIDTSLSHLFYYADRQNIPICIGCYCLLSATNLPQDSHIISNWYLRKVVNLGIQAPKSTFVTHEAEMKTVTKTENMTMPMLCRNCEDMHSPLEGALGKFSPAVDALFSLRVNGLMPGEEIFTEPTHLKFLEPSDNLTHATLYGFMVTNLMRLLGSELRKPNIAEHMWELFDRLRAEIRMLSETTKASSEGGDLFVYCIPIGGKNFLQLVRKFSEIGLGACDFQFSQFDIYSGDGDTKYFATIQSPLVLVGSVKEVSAFAAYQIIPDKNECVVLSLAECNTQVFYTLYSLHILVLMASKATIYYAACADTEVDYSTADAADRTKNVKFCNEMVNGWVEKLKGCKLHWHLLVWCEVFDDYATEDLYSQSVEQLLCCTSSDRLEIRLKAALKQLSCDDIKLFTKCLGDKLRKLIPWGVPKVNLPIATEEKNLEIVNFICNVTGCHSHVYRLNCFYTYLL